MSGYSVDYFHKNSERTVSVVIFNGLVQLLILSLNKILKIYYLVFALSGLGVENDVSGV